MSTPKQAPVTSTSVTSERRRIVFAKSVANAAIWVARGLIILAGIVVLWFLIRALWSIVLPTVLALLLSSILWPLNRVLRKALPAVLAAMVSLLALIGAVVGVGMLVVPTIASGVTDLTSAAGKNIEDITGFVAGPPFNFPAFDLESLINTGAEQLRENSGAVVSGITAGVGTVGSWLVVLLLTLVLTFFCLKDGDKFLVWTRRWTNGRTYTHAANIGEGVWKTLSAYISSQALVALVDAVFIGIGLVILDIPLAMPLAVIIFFAGFIPIVGAVSTGVLATVIALFSHGWVTALMVLGIVLLVQQLESNVLQPAIVGRVLKIHPAVVLGSVVAGGTLFGIVGAFLAVPTTAAVIVVFRYLRDQSLKVRATPADPVSPDPGAVDPAIIDPVAAAAAAPVPTVPDADDAAAAAAAPAAGDGGESAGAGATNSADPATPGDSSDSATDTAVTRTP